MISPGDRTHLLLTATTTESKLKKFNRDIYRDGKLVHSFDVENQIIGFFCEDGILSTTSIIVVVNTIFHIIIGSTTTYCCIITVMHACSWNEWSLFFLSGWWRNIILVFCRQQIDRYSYGDKSAIVTDTLSHDISATRYLLLLLLWIVRHDDIYDYTSHSTIIIIIDPGGGWPLVLLGMPSARAWRGGTDRLSENEVNDSY